MPSKDTRRINPPASTKSVTCFKKTRLKYPPLLSNGSTRNDKRTLDEIRPMYIKPGNMAGHAFCELANLDRSYFLHGSLKCQRIIHVMYKNF